MYGYNPYQNMQPRYSSPSLVCRMVTNMEEARASQIPIDGTPSYFPCPAENRIYVKSVGLDGMPVFNVYELAQIPAAPTYADAQSVQSLVARVEQLEQYLKGGVKHEPVSTNANASKQR